MSEQKRNMATSTGSVTCERCLVTVKHYVLPCFAQTCNENTLIKEKGTGIFCSFCGLPTPTTDQINDTKSPEKAAGQGYQYDINTTTVQQVEEIEQRQKFDLETPGHLQHQNISQQHYRHSVAMITKNLAMPPGSTQRPLPPPQQAFAASRLSSEQSGDTNIMQAPIHHHRSMESMLDTSVASSSYGSSVADHQQSANVPFETFQQNGNIGPHEQGLLRDGTYNASNYGQGYNNYHQQTSVAQQYQTHQGQQHLGQQHLAQQTQGQHRQGQLTQSQMNYQAGQPASQMLGYYQLPSQYPPQQQYPQYMQAPNTNQSLGAVSNIGPNAAYPQHSLYSNVIDNLPIHGGDLNHAHKTYGPNHFQDHFGQPLNYQQGGAQSQSNQYGQSQGRNQPYGMGTYSIGGQPQNRATSQNQGPDNGQVRGFQAASGTGDNLHTQASRASFMGTTLYKHGQYNSHSENSAHSSFDTESTGVAETSSFSTTIPDELEFMTKQDEATNKTPMNKTAQITFYPQTDSAVIVTSRTRKSESAGPFKIDPTRGPPPAFWPRITAKSDEAVLSPSKQLASHVVQAQTVDANVLDVKSGDNADPFTTGDLAHQTHGIPPSDYQPPRPQASTATASNLPNIFTQMQAPPSGPLILPPRTELRMPSKHLASIAVDGKVPSVEVALNRQNIPFVTSVCEYSHPATTGVVRMSNIPYSVTRQEIVAFLGRNARIINEVDEPVHIIMERVTSKTMDAYVEFVSVSEAITAVQRYENNRLVGRGGRLGERHVDLEVVGHERLMKDLFPKAKNVRWDNAVPVVLPTDPNDKYNSGFKGFVSSEELVMLVKHVETPHRSPFSRECPQRPFECIISTLVKFPWYMINHITLRDRNEMYKCAHRLFELLLERLEREPDNTSIDARLLKRFQRAVFKCPGFLESMKDNFAFASGLTEVEAGLVPYAAHWRVWKTIGPKQGCEWDVLDYYQALIREGTEAEPLADRFPAPVRWIDPNIFGVVKLPFPEDLDTLLNMSLGDIAAIEWSVIEKLIRRRLALGNIN